MALAAAGAHVVAVARTVGGLEELDDEIKAKGGSATLVPLDLKDFAGIDRLGAALYERWGKLDILLGNAGLLGAVTPLGPSRAEGLRRGDGGQRHRQLAADPLARSAAPPIRRRARALRHLGDHQIVRRLLGRLLGLEGRARGLVRTYAAEIGRRTLRANLFNPGTIRTRMRAQAMPGEDPMTLPPPEALVPDIVRMLSPTFAENGVLFDYPAQTLTRFPV